MMWHFGNRIAPEGKRRWWVNQWLAHPCSDLAFPFEVGPRVMAWVSNDG